MLSCAKESFGFSYYNNFWVSLERREVIFLKDNVDCLSSRGIEASEEGEKSWGDLSNKYPKCLRDNLLNKTGDFEWRQKNGFAGKGHFCRAKISTQFVYPVWKAIICEIFSYFEYPPFPSLEPIVGFLRLVGYPDLWGRVRWI